MATPPASTPRPVPTARQRFLKLQERDILKLELAEPDFGIYRILNYRRTQIKEYLEQALPARIDAWTAEFERAGESALAVTEAANCYYHLHTFFGRYWDDGDFIPRARRGGTAAYAVPYNGQDTHFHWATKGSHYVKSGELFARYAYQDGGRQVRFVIEHAEVEDEGVAPTEDASLQERVLNAWLAGNDFAAAKPAKGLSTELLAKNARRFVRVASTRRWRSLNPRACATSGRRISSTFWSALFPPGNSRCR